MNKTEEVELEVCNRTSRTIPWEMRRRDALHLVSALQTRYKDELPYKTFMLLHPEDLDVAEQAYYPTVRVVQGCWLTDGGPYYRWIAVKQAAPCVPKRS